QWEEDDVNDCDGGADGDEGRVRGFLSGCGGTQQHVGVSLPRGVVRGGAQQRAGAVEARGGRPTWWRRSCVVGRGQEPFGSHQGRRLFPIHPARSWCRGRGPVIPVWSSPLAGVQSRVEMGDEEDVVLSVVVEDQRGAAQGEDFTAGGTYG